MRTSKSEGEFEGNRREKRNCLTSKGEIAGIGQYIKQHIGNDNG